VAAEVAVGEAAYKELIERCTGHYAELAQPRNCVGKAPIRHAYTHAALNNLGKLDHL
jgi:hypothetical protein